MPLPPTYQPLRFEHLAGRKVAIYDGHQKAVEGTAASSLEIARHLATGMDVKGVDDAFVLFNLDVVVERFLQWRAMLPRVHPFYAVKCNNDPVLLKLLADLGCGFDCASRGEIDQIVEAGHAGCGGEHVIYANPCKTRSYIRHADQMGIRRMTFDSVGELTKILECHSYPELLIRIAVADPTAQCPLAIKFGCDPLEEAPKLIKAATEMGLQLVGVSFHVGSGCRDPHAFGLAILAARKLFDLGLSLGHPMSLLDIGGGFPGQDNEQITFGEIVDIVQRALDEHFPADSDLPVEVIAEPGRFFGASPVSLCANVIATTEVSATRVTKRAEDAEMEGQMLYVNDGVYGSFNCILFDHSQPRGRPLFEAAAEKGPLADEEEKMMIPTIVWGQTCDGLDQIEAQTTMRRLRVGDWLYYDQMGAYTSVAASHFNGFDNPRAFYAISHRCWNAVYVVETDAIVDENFLVPEAEERRQDE